MPGTAGASTLSDTPEPARPAFYEPPAQIPSTPGTVIRQEKADNVLDPLDASSLSYDARRVMYSSKDREGNPIAVTALVVSPKAPWVGPGKRPIISYAAGTQGMADACAPSRQLQAMTEYETIFFKDLLFRGYTVALTDYQGLGTPGTHTYMVREAQGHAVLDLARATQRVGLPGTDTSTPVGLSGYSQGGGAAAAAAEMAAAYAPELDVKGTVAGAVPADLAAVSRQIDRSMYSAFELYATAGMFTAYHIDPKNFLNDKGLALGPKVESNCVTNLFDLAFIKSSTLTKDGRPMDQTFAEEPLRSMLADNRIGRSRPSAPVLITHSVSDDVIPYAVGQQLGKDWCAQGANVWFQPILTPTHLGGAVPTASYATTFFESRFNGIKQVSNCGMY
ncbi:lipase [Arsenicicoccus sp. oral taxon 190]|nr:lipase [Arsenicicoccus sp. oral taxon 190]